MKKAPQYLLMGPWTHGKYEVPHAGDLDLGMRRKQINYQDLKLVWFDHFLKGMHTEVADWRPVRIFTMGTGDGKRVIEGAPGEASEYPGRVHHGGFSSSAENWPLLSARPTPYYLQGDGTLSPEKPVRSDMAPSRYTFDPKDPVPTLGGGISAAEVLMKPGAFDQRGHGDFIGCTDRLPLSSRSDVLTFQTLPLESETEITGPIQVHLRASSSVVDTDFTAKLMDVYPPGDDYPDGLAINLTDSIIWARYRKG